MSLTSQQAILLGMYAQSPMAPIALRAVYQQLQTTTLLHIALNMIPITLVLITVARQVPFTRTAAIRTSYVRHMLHQNHLPHQIDTLVEETRNLVVTGQLMVDQRVEDGKRNRCLLPISFVTGV